MIGEIRILFLVAGLFFGCESSDEAPKPTPEPKPEIVDPPAQVEKTNPMQVYMHYMPWFQTKAVSGYWGSHWTMDNRNPEVMDANGKREIAAHYYPLIGPYDSKDPDVLEYHMLLMKYSGIDGVLIDWYGTHNVYDYRPNFTSSNALIEKANEIGLEFAIVYEEYSAENVGKQTSLTALEAAQEDLKYMESDYFSQDSYIEIEGKPLLMTFGPRYFRQQSQWNQIFDAINTDLLFLPLWHHSHHVGNTGDGEFSWVDFNASFSELSTFYSDASNKSIIGSAYPRFHDFYQEGGVGSSYGRVYSNSGQTLKATLNMAKDNNLDHIQLVTWNDFGEGTQIEPTEEDQYLFLEIIQAFTGVTYQQEALELIYTYYLKKKELKGTDKEETLKEVYQHLIDLEVEEAKQLIEGL